MSDDIASKIADLKEQTGVPKLVRPAKGFWITLEEQQEPKTFLWILESIVEHDATAEEFFRAYVYGLTDSIEAAIYFLGYWMRISDEERNKLVDIHNEFFNKSSDPLLLIETAIEELELKGERERFLSLVSDTCELAFATTEEKHLEIGCSKLGGSPDLPKDFPWPTGTDDIPLPFLLQINLGECDFLKSIDPLPREGLLLFFLPSDPEDNDSKVIYIPEEQFPLSRRERPAIPEESLEFYEPIEYYESPLPIAEVFFSDGISLPEIEVVKIKKLLPESDLEKYEQFYELVYQKKYEENGPFHQLLGDISTIQNFAPESPLLLQLDSDPGIDLIWGDGGKISYCAKRIDLKDLGHIDFLFETH